MSQRHAALRFSHPLPYGAIIHDGGVQFVVFSRSATAMRVLLYDRTGDPEPAEIIDFDADLNRWGDVWSIFVPGVGPGQLYHFQADGPHEPQRGYRFDPQARLIDPYAKALAGDFLPAEGGVLRPPKCVVSHDEFDWQGDRHLRRSLAETIIYEIHVRGFTQSPTSEVLHPGTYLGVMEKIPYLKSLGVTAVELMPVHEFPIRDCLGQVPPRPNYWGYDPLCFFAPHRGYAVGEEPGSQVREFKEMVRALHSADIEVILDVVFNHTAEGNEQGPTLSFKGLENRVYYMLENGGQYYRNYTGCGNTLNGNHPIVREMIFHCLRHWVHNYHVDGFRFDLAAALARQFFEVNRLSAFFDLIHQDPVLAEVKLIAEPWDIGAGGYQVGNFPVGWAEWNGKYRDTVRDYWRGAPIGVADLAYRLTGSSDLYADDGRGPSASMNFVTAHDGFTLRDLVSYSAKHNQANGEDGRDGSDDNRSWNCGVEGETGDVAVNQLRRQQARNFLATLLLSQGSPMILSGDELGRTQQGNNNAYCQDNEISWIDWEHDDPELFHFTRSLIALRAAHPVLRRQRFFTGRVVGGGLKDVRWLRRNGVEMTDEDWGSHERQSLTMILDGGLIADRTANGERIVDDTLAVLLHSAEDPCEWDLPPGDWEVLIDTAHPAEEPAARRVAQGARLHVEARSLVVLRLAAPTPEAAPGATSGSGETAKPTGPSSAGRA